MSESARPVVYGAAVPAGISKGLRAEFYRRASFTNDGEVSPETIAFRDAICSFPSPTKMLVIEAGDGTYAGVKVDQFTYLRFDLVHLGNAQFQDLGRAPISDLGAREDLLLEIFGERRSEDSRRDV